MKTFIPASWPRDAREQERLLVIQSQPENFEHRRVIDLPGLLSAGDVCVVNDSATLPASLSGMLEPKGSAIEIRLLARDDARDFRAVIFGEGDFRTKTENRLPAPAISETTPAVFGSLRAQISPTRVHPRLIRVHFDSSLREADFESRLYSSAKPIQYAHVRDELPLFNVQTSFASRPWSFEMPSAARPLTWSILNALRARGIVVARLTHAAGLSSTGDDELDALLPLDERYDIPNETVGAIQNARRNGSRVVAVGTTVVRALEGCVAERGELRGGVGVTTLHIRAGFEPRIVSAVYTGMHDIGTSHADLMAAFASRNLLERANEEARSLGYLGHEYGDSTLIFSSSRKPESK